MLGAHGDIEIANVDPIVMLSLGTDASFTRRTGRAVVAGLAGFELVDLATRTVRRWSHEAGQLSGAIVFSVVDGGNGIFWLGTEAGLERLDTRSSARSTVTGAAQGLPGGIVMTVTKRGDHLLLGTNQGVAEVTTDTHPKVVTILDGQDGLSDTEMARYGHALAPEGTLYLASANGLSILAADAPRPIPVTVSALGDVAVQVNGDRQAAASVIKASVGDRIDVSWVTQNMWRPEQTRFEYRLAGGDAGGWTSVFARSSASFRPSAGDYTFQVRVLGIGGEVVAERNQHLSVLPPWYDSWTFRGIVVALLVLAALWFVLAARRRRRILEDLVRSRTAEAETRRTEAETVTRELESLLRRVSHDLRSPLNVMVGAMDIMQSTGEAARENRWLGMGRTAGRRLTLMLDDLVAHARSASGTGWIPEIGPIDLAGPVSESVEAVVGTILKPDRGITVSFEQTSPTVMAETGALHHVLTDVLLNAITHSRPGEISVRCHDGEDPNVTMISVVDPGSGSTDPDWARVHQPYRRGAAAGGIGLGLGLTVAQDTCRRLGGRLTILTEPERTEVQITLTTAVRPVRLIMLVDDGSAALAPARERLQALSYQVSHTSRPSDVNRMLVDNEPDCIVVTHPCGDLSGADLLEQAASRTGASWGPRIIAVAAHPAQARADGRYAVVVSLPINPDRLIEAIQQLDDQTTRGGPSLSATDSHTSG